MKSVLLGRHRNKRRNVAAMIALVFLSASYVHAGDWPQILGPRRTAIAAADEKLISEFPRAGLKPLWEVSCGAGFAGVAVVADQVILFDRASNREQVTAYLASTGKQLWRQTFTTSFQANIVEDNGPRCVPTIAQEKIVVFGAQGGLRCLDLKTGAVAWTRETHQEFGAQEGYFGAGSSPLIDQGRVIVNVGGPKGAGVVAFELATGKVLWKTSNEQASYSAPIAATQGGTSRYLVLTRLNLLGLEPESGQEIFRVPFGARGPTVNAATPVVIGDDILLTASYGIGAKLVHVASGSAEVTWASESLSSQYTTPIVQNGMIFGIDGRQDGGPVTLKCLDVKTRQELWSESGLGYATLIAADDKLLVVQTDGSARLVAAEKSAYRELGRAQLMNGETRALPALSNGRLYLKTSSRLASFNVQP